MPKKAHFIGIGGVGMSATAKLLKDAGVEVTGSDEAVYPPISTFLEKSGLTYQTPYAAKNIPFDVDLIVIGKSAKLVPQTNEEVAAAFAKGVKILSFPEVLNQLSVGKDAIVVAGSYGKSTTDALLSHVLLEAGLDPSYFIGAIPVAMPNAHMGKGSLFVLEGDEYPSSNTDPRSKFLLMHPKHVLLTPLAHDHFNIFPTPESYLKPFLELATLTDSFVVCIESPMSKEFVSRIGKPVVTYGVHEGEFTATNIQWGERTTFEINLPAQAGGTKIETSLLGEHNIQNIVGVAALVFTLKLMTGEQFAKGVASFKGVTRRLDRKSEKTVVPIYEGFGSSYEKLKSAIAAMKLHFPNRRLIVVFEPHTFSWRNRESLPWYDTAFVGASQVYMFEPPEDGKETQLTLDEMVARVGKAGIECHGAHKPEEILDALMQTLRPEDAVLLSSSGAMGGLIESIPQLAERTFPR